MRDHSSSIRRRSHHLQAARAFIRLARRCFVLAMSMADHKEWDLYDKFTGLGIDAILQAQHRRERGRQVGAQ